MQLRKIHVVQMCLYRWTCSNQPWSAQACLCPSELHHFVQICSTLCGSLSETQLSKRSLLQTCSTMEHHREGIIASNKSPHKTTASRAKPVSPILLVVEVLRDISTQQRGFPNSALVTAQCDDWNIQLPWTVPLTVTKLVAPLPRQQVWKAQASSGSWHIEKLSLGMKRHDWHLQAQRYCPQA